MVMEQVFLAKGPLQLFVGMSSISQKLSMIHCSQRPPKDSGDRGVELLRNVLHSNPGRLK